MEKNEGTILSVISTLYDNKMSAFLINDIIKKNNLEILVLFLNISKSNDNQNQQYVCVSALCFLHSLNTFLQMVLAMC